MRAIEQRRRAWRGRRVLVTGHTGFKGAWLSLWLQRLGAEVTGYALAPPSNPSLFDLAGVAEGMRSVRGDVRDLEALLKVFREQKPEVVLHLAAQALVRPGYDQPVETFGANVMGTVHVLEAVRRTPGVEAVVVVTSDKCYENREWLWPYRENEPMGGKDPYSSSKGCAELVTASYRDSFFTGRHMPAVASARAGNVIGGGDWALDRLIPDMVRGILAGREVHIRNPHAIRPWQHVLEALDGYLVLTERLLEEGASVAEGWNFGPSEDDAQPVGWVVKTLVDAWQRTTGEDVAWSMAEGEQPPEANLLKLDATKARVRLGWRPRLALPAALEWIVEWTRCYQNQGSVRSLTEEQIGRFEMLADEEP
ncbi:MAG: CDP-glucose 4,6-dehydratase [Acidobacteriota bacterium]